eukprot:6281476-Alexandrium_andersonii.AAC.1
MSASLVGSEMCIRDRGKRMGGRKKARADGERRALQHAKDKPLGDPQNPVSYTHLTLPTICSV